MVEDAPYAQRGLMSDVGGHSGAGEGGVLTSTREQPYTTAIEV